MRARYLAAAGFVVAVSALLAIRHAGYLGGRVVGGPLEVGLGGSAVSVTARPSQVRFVMLPFALRGSGVRMQEVEPDFVSPGLDVVGPRIPHQSRLSGRPVTSRLRAVNLGLRARRPGVYYAEGLTADYRRGQRRFRYHDDQQLCLSVGRRARCAAYAVPSGAAVAEAGGPSNYGVRLSAADPPRGGLEARIPAVPGRRSIRLTLTNLTHRTVTVSDPEIPAIGGSGLTVKPDGAAPHRFSLAPQAGRSVRLSMRIAGCETGGVSLTVSRITAGVGGERVDVPLSVALAFVSQPGCRP